MQLKHGNSIKRVQHSFGITVYVSLFYLLWCAKNTGSNSLRLGHLTSCDIILISC